MPIVNGDAVVRMTKRKKVEAMNLTETFVRSMIFLSGMGLIVSSFFMAETIPHSWGWFTIIGVFISGGAFSGAKFK